MKYEDFNSYSENLQNFIRWAESIYDMSLHEIDMRYLGRLMCQLHETKSSAESLIEALVYSEVKKNLLAMKKEYENSTGGLISVLDVSILVSYITNEILEVGYRKEAGYIFRYKTAFH